MIKNPLIIMPDSSDILFSKPADDASRATISDRLESIEADMGAFGAFFDTKLLSIAEELRRAQARDEWISTQLLDARRTIREQGQILEEIKSLLVRGKQGFF